MAIKTIRKQLDDGSDFGQSIAARFRNEAQAAGRLLHPASWRCTTTVGWRCGCIAMEYVEGNNLSRYLANRICASPTTTSQRDGPGLTRALDHAHQQGVAPRHRPANLIADRAGRVKIADWHARIESSGADTQASTMIGTPTHMAPEQFLL